MAIGWKLYGDGRTPPPGEVVRTGRTAVVGRAPRASAPSTWWRCSVRRSCSRGDGARPQPRHHDVRGRHDPVPAHRARPGPELPGHERLVRRRGRGDPRGGRRHGDGDRRHPRRRPGARADRPADPLRGRRGHPPGVPAGRHRCRRDADRIQPRTGRRQRLLAPGPVGRAGDAGLRGAVRGPSPRLLGTHHDPSGAGLRVRAVVDPRQDDRPGHLGAAGPEPARRERPAVHRRGPVLRGHRLPPRPGRLQRRGGGRLVRAAEHARAPTSRPPRSCWRCRRSSRCSPRTPGTSRPSPR